MTQYIEKNIDFPTGIKSENHTGKFVHRFPIQEMGRNPTGKLEMDFSSRNSGEFDKISHTE